jgi:hypothetical protein
MGTLDEKQSAVLEKIFAILRASSGGFRQDRLFYLVGEDHALWSDACTEALRQRIAATAPPGIHVRLRYFRMAAGCLCLECLPGQIAA